MYEIFDPREPGTAERPALVTVAFTAWGAKRKVKRLSRKDVRRWYDYAPAGQGW